MANTKRKALWSLLNDIRRTTSDLIVWRNCEISIFGIMCIISFYNTLYYLLQKNKNEPFIITCCIFAHVTTDVTTMKSVGIANPNTQIVNTYDIFMFSECQSGVQLIRISVKYFWLVIMPILSLLECRLSESTYPRLDISGWYFPQPTIGGRESITA